MMLAFFLVLSIHRKVLSIHLFIVKFYLFIVSTSRNSIAFVFLDTILNTIVIGAVNNHDTCINNST